MRIFGPVMNSRVYFCHGESVSPNFLWVTIFRRFKVSEVNIVFLSLRCRPAHEIQALEGYDSLFLSLEFSWVLTSRPFKRTIAAIVCKLLVLPKTFSFGSVLSKKFLFKKLFLYSPDIISICFHIGRQIDATLPLPLCFVVQL